LSSGFPARGFARDEVFQLTQAGGTWPEGPLVVDGNLYCVGWIHTLSKWDGEETVMKIPNAK